MALDLSALLTGINASIAGAQRGRLAGMQEREETQRRLSLDALNERISTENVLASQQRRRLAQQEAEQRAQEAQRAQAEMEAREAFLLGEVGTEGLDQSFQELSATDQVAELERRRTLANRPSPAGAAPSIQRIAGPDGTPMLVAVDPRTGTSRVIQDPSGDPAEAFSPPSEGERKASSFLQALTTPDANGRLPGDDIDEFVGSPNRAQQILSDRGLRDFTSQEQRILNNASALFAEAWLRMTTGAAYSETEFETAQGLFVPRPGDGQAVLQRKKANRDRLMLMLETASGRATLPPPVDPGTGRVVPLTDREQALLESGQFDDRPRPRNPFEDLIPARDSTRRSGRRF